MAMQNKNPFTWVRSHKVLSIFALVGVIVTVFWAVQAYQKHQNKVAFQQARAAIDTVYADIVAKVGQPAASKQINSCSRHHQEFEEGPLSCAVGTSFIYAIADRNEATQKYKAIQSVIIARPDQFKPIGQLSSAITDELVVNTYYHSAFDHIRTHKNMDCAAKYIYDTPREMDLMTNSLHGIQTNIICSDWAKQQIYPL
jgi:hypothetical protein